MLKVEQVTLLNLTKGFSSYWDSLLMSKYQLEICLHTLVSDNRHVSTVGDPVNTGVGGLLSHLALSMVVSPHWGRTP